MALALHMFSVAEPLVGTLESVGSTDERWAWVALAMVREVGGNARRYDDLLRLGPPSEVFQAPAAGAGRHGRRGRGRRPREIRLAAGGTDPGGGRGAVWRAARPGGRCGVPPVAPGRRSPTPLPPGPGGALPRGRARRRHRGVSSRIRLWPPDGGAARGRPRGSRRHGGQRAGPWGGYRRPPGGARGGRTNRRRAGLGGRRGVSTREPPAGRRDHGSRGRGLPVPDGDGAAAAPLPGAEPGHRGVDAGHRGRRGRRPERGAHHRPPGGRAGPGGLRGAGERLVPGEPGHERAHPGRREARAGLGGRGGGVAAGVAAGAADPSVARGRPPGAPGSNPGSGAILALLGDEPVAVDAMVERSGLAPGLVSAGLTALELRGLARRVAGQRYVRGSGL